MTKVDDISNLQDEFCPDNIYSDKGTENESLFDETLVEPRHEIELKDEEIDYNLRNNVNINIERKTNVRIFPLVKIQPNKRRIIEKLKLPLGRWSSLLLVIALPPSHILVEVLSPQYITVVTAQPQPQPNSTSTRVGIDKVISWTTHPHHPHLNF